MTTRILRLIGFLSIIFTLIPGHLLKSQTVADMAVIAESNQFGLTIWNFGLLGNGYTLQNGEIRPSAQYKLHPSILREQVEHFSHAGLWVGGMVGGQARVSTAIVDGVFESGAEGFEYVPLTLLTERSNITTSPIYDPDAVSHQDFTTRFTDVFPASIPVVPNHVPLGIEVTMRTYGWDFSFAEAFVIFEYTIKNVNPSVTISNIYAGIWVDAAISNMNYRSIYEPGGGFSWYDDLDGFDETVDAAGFPRDMGYEYDADSDDGWAETYIAFKTLGGSVPQPYLKTFYSQWPWNTSINTLYPLYVMALTDAERYAQLSSSVPPGDRSDPLYLPADGYPADPDCWLFLHSAGPLGSVPVEGDLTNWELPPGDSLKVVFALVAAPWATSGIDSPARRAALHTHADWAQKAYDGEDVNRNNVLDPGEDRDSDGTLDRYLLPPGVPQNLTVEWNYPVVTLRWNPPKFPVSGYNIYRSHNRGIFERINTTMVTDTVYSDSGVSPDSLTAYYVTCVDEYDEESVPSNIVKDYSSPPQITFRYGSNTIVSNPNVTARTFPTRTFIWEATDVDGQETISIIAYALDDTTAWVDLDGSQRSVTLRDILAGNHTFYVKAIDDFGLSSQVICFPDTNDDSSPNYWEVLPVVGDILLVDDFPWDPKNNALTWYRSILDTIPGVGIGGYSVWEIGSALPFSETDVSATLGYFKHIIWYAATNGPETYGDASNPINQFLQNGGNIFINVTQIYSSSTVWFPFDSTAVVNPTGRLFSGTIIESTINTDLDLEISRLIPYSVRSFAINDTSALDPVLGPSFTPLYRMPEATATDPWIGRPIVAAEYDHRSANNDNAGKAILFSIPLHDGTSIGGATMEGNGSGAKFISYVLRDFALGVEHTSSVLPDRTILHPAYPNPLNPSTTLRYELPEGTMVRLMVYDLLGREVTRLAESYQQPGYHESIWDGCDATGRLVPSGIYIARLVTPEYSKSIKMVLLK